jgi:hypothetical protein
MASLSSPFLSSLWLDLKAQATGVVLLQYYRPYTAIHELKAPDYQDPQMIMCIGGVSKSVCMNRLSFSVVKERPHSKVRLDFVPGTTQSQSPVLIADCELHNVRVLEKANNGPIPGDVDQLPLRWHTQVPEGFDSQTIANLVYTKLISPFSNVICLFPNDLGGMEGVARLLASWLMNLTISSSDLPSSTRPRILILKEWNDLRHGMFDQQLATRAFIEKMAQEVESRNRNRVAGHQSKLDVDHLLSQQSSNIQVLVYPTHPSPTPHTTAEDVEFHLRRLDQSWSSLRRRILQESQDVQEHRRKCQVAFSANHFKALFHSACTHFSVDILTPFSHIKASRLPNPVPEDLPFHIISFLKLIPRKLHMTFGVPVIASSLSLDSYPPEMHCKCQQSHGKNGLISR